MNNLAPKKNCPGVQGKLNWPWTIMSFNFPLSRNVYYNKNDIFLQMSIWRLWQASVTFYSHVHEFMFILVAFCDEIFFYYI